MPPAARITDMHTCPVPTHVGGPVSAGESSVLIGYMPASRVTDMLVCATGLSYEEAADVCQVAVGTIKSRIARARDRLVELLGEDATQVTGSLPAVNSLSEPSISERRSGAS